MKKYLSIVITAVICLSLGFLAGFEYQSYRIRKTLNEEVGKAVLDAFGGENATQENETFQEKIEEVKGKVIEKGLGEVVEFATMKIKVNSSEEKNLIGGGFGTPLVAKEGSKFVLINMDVTNTTKTEFNFDPDVVLIDNLEREFTPYGATSLDVENLLDWRTLSPSITENGVIVYELPSDSASYSLLIGKAGTDEYYNK